DRREDHVRHGSPAPALPGLLRALEPTAKIMKQNLEAAFLFPLGQRVDRPVLLTVNLLFRERHCFGFCNRAVCSLLTLHGILHGENVLALLPGLFVVRAAAIRAFSIRTNRVPAPSVLGRDKPYLALLR